MTTLSALSMMKRVSCAALCCGKFNIIIRNAACRWRVLGLFFAASPCVLPPAGVVPAVAYDDFANSIRCYCPWHTMFLPVGSYDFYDSIQCFCQTCLIFRAERLYLSMDAVRGCGDCPPCPGFKHGRDVPDGRGVIGILSAA